MLTFEALGGPLTLQDHDPARGVVDRRMMAAARAHAPIRSAPDYDETPALGTYGDVRGGFLWEEADGARDHLHSWWLTGPGIVNLSGSDGWRPIQFEGAQPDLRYQRKSPARPSWVQGEFPKGWTGLASEGTDEKTQQENLHPDFWGLVAPNAHGPAQAGTHVYDLDSSGTPDAERWARLQSAWTVLDLDPGGCGVTGRALAQNVGRGGRLDGGAGYWPLCDHDSRLVGIGSAVGGRPGLVTLGDRSCVHSLGQDADGRQMHPAHLPADGTGGFYIWPGVGDGPLAFEAEPWKQVQPDGTYWLRGHIRFDREQFHSACGKPYPGKWGVQVAVPFFSTPPPPPDPQPPPPPFDPPPPLPPPFDPPPPEDGGGTGGIGFLPGDEIISLPPEEDGVGFIPGPPITEEPGGIGFTGSVLQFDGFTESVLQFDSSFQQIVGAEGKDRRWNFTEATAFGQILVKAFATTPGEPLVPTIEQFLQAPAVGQITGVAPGAGTWDGFSVLAFDDAYQHAVAAGAMLVLPAETDARAYVEGTSSTPQSVLSFTFPPNYSQLHMGDAARGNANGIGEGVRIAYSPGDNDLKFTYVSADGTDSTSLLLGALGGGATGDVTGPGSATDNALVRFDGTGGKNIQNSTGWTLSDAGAMSGSSLTLSTQLGVTSGGTGLNAISSGQTLYSSGANTLAASDFATAFAAVEGGGSGAWVVQSGAWSALGTTERTYLGSPSGGAIGFQGKLDLTHAVGGAANATFGEIEMTGHGGGDRMLILDAHRSSGSDTTGDSYGVQVQRGGTTVGYVRIAENDGTGAGNYDLGIFSDSSGNDKFVAFDRSLNGARIESDGGLTGRNKTGSISAPASSFWTLGVESGSPKMRVNVGGTTTDWSLVKTQSGPGAPTGWTDSTAEAWAASLYTAITGSGLMV